MRGSTVGDLICRLICHNPDWEHPLPCVIVLQRHKSQHCLSWVRWMLRTQPAPNLPSNCRGLWRFRSSLILACWSKRFFNPMQLSAYQQRVKNRCWEENANNWEKGVISLVWKLFEAEEGFLGIRSSCLGRAFQRSTFQRAGQNRKWSKFVSHSPWAVKRA